MGTGACAHGASEAGTASWHVASVPAAPAKGAASARTWPMASAATVPGASQGHSAR